MSDEGIAAAPASFRVEVDPRDPPVRADGLCAWCDGERKLPKRRDCRLQAMVDPFCSSLCCQLWHEDLDPRRRYPKRAYV